MKELTDKEINELPVPKEIKALMRDAVSRVRLLERQVAGSIELAYWRGKQGKPA